MSPATCFARTAQAQRVFFWPPVGWVAEPQGRRETASGDAFPFDTVPGPGPLSPVLGIRALWRGCLSPPTPSHTDPPPARMHTALLSVPRVAHTCTLSKEGEGWGDQAAEETEPSPAGALRSLSPCPCTWTLVALGATSLICTESWLEGECTPPAPLLVLPRPGALALV